jgi:hypothetical protein
MASEEEFSEKLSEKSYSKEAKEAIKQWYCPEKQNPKN